VKRKLEAVTFSWNQLKEFTNVAAVCVVRKKEKAGIIPAYVVCGGALAIINERERER